MLDSVTIALCAVIGGADSWVEVERFGHAKEPWLRRVLALNLLRREPTATVDIKARRLMAGWDEADLHKDLAA